jgi:hypothetical protein
MAIMTADGCLNRLCASWTGQPTHIRSHDLDSERLLKDRGLLEAHHDKDKLETQVYLALLELSEHSHLALDSGPMSSKIDDTQRHLLAASRDRQLRLWYRKLPQALKWTEDTARTTAPAVFFLQ